MFSNDLQKTISTWGVRLKQGKATSTSKCCFTDITGKIFGSLGSVGRFEKNPDNHDTFSSTLWLTQCVHPFTLMTIFGEITVAAENIVTLCSSGPCPDSIILSLTWPRVVYACVLGSLHLVLDPYNIGLLGLWNISCNWSSLMKTSLQTVAT